MGMADMSLEVMAYQLRQQWENATKDMLLEELIRVKAIAKWNAEKIHSLVLERNDAKQRSAEAERKLAAARNALDGIKAHRAWIPDTVFAICEKALAQIEQPNKEDADRKAGGRSA